MISSKCRIDLRSKSWKMLCSLQKWVMLYGYSSDGFLVSEALKVKKRDMRFRLLPVVQVVLFCREYLNYVSIIPV